jgi:fructose-1-phosphate kinase PfkB-like protein
VAVAMTTALPEIAPANLPLTGWWGTQGAYDLNSFNEETALGAGGNVFCGIGGGLAYASLHQLPPSVAGVTIVGDLNAKLFRETAAGECQGLIELVEVDGTTRTNVSEILRGVESFRPGYSKFSISPRQFTNFVARTSRLRPGDIGVLSGSEPPGLPSGWDLLASTATAIVETRAQLGFDLRGEDFLRLYRRGIYPDFWKANWDEFAGVARHLIDKNYRTMASLRPDQATLELIVDHIETLLPDADVLISLGRWGLVLRTRDGRAWHVTAELPEGYIRKSAVGSGDVTWAWLLEGLKLVWLGVKNVEEVVVEAAAAGVANLATLKSGRVITNLVQGIALTALTTVLRG